MVKKEGLLKKNGAPKKRRIRKIANALGLEMPPEGLPQPRAFVNALTELAQECQKE